MSQPIDPETGSPMFENLLVAIDAGGHGADVLALARTLASPAATITTVHVTGRDDGAAVTADVVAEGPFHTALARLVGERAIDLLVVGAHHREHIWSTNHVRAALHAVACSVAIAPEGYASAAPGPISVIGVAYDEGPEAERALAAARTLAADSGASIELIEVVPDSNLVASDSVVGWKAQGAAGRLSVVDGVAVRVLEGDTLTRLREAARGVDLMVVGAHHPDLPSRLLLGRTGERLALGLDCPLLLQHG